MLLMMKTLKTYNPAFTLWFHRYLGIRPISGWLLTE